MIQSRVKVYTNLNIDNFIQVIDKIITKYSIKNFNRYNVKFSSTKTKLFKCLFKKSLKKKQQLQ